jgi:hypothetical protein
LVFTDKKGSTSSTTSTPIFGGQVGKVSLPSQITGRNLKRSVDAAFELFDDESLSNGGSEEDIPQFSVDNTPFKQWTYNNLNAFEEHNTVCTIVPIPFPDADATVDITTDGLQAHVTYRWPTLFCHADELLLASQSAVSIHDPMVASARKVMADMGIKRSDVNSLPKANMYISFPFKVNAEEVSSRLDTVNGVDVLTIVGSRYVPPPPQPQSIKIQILKTQAPTRNNDN